MQGLDNPFEAARYHSLVIEKESCPDDLEVTAWTEDGIIMGVQHKQHAHIQVGLSTSGMHGVHAYDGMTHIKVGSQDSCSCLKPVMCSCHVCAKPLTSEMLMRRGSNFTPRASSHTRGRQSSKTLLMHWMGSCVLTGIPLLVGYKYDLRNPVFNTPCCVCTMHADAQTLCKIVWHVSNGSDGGTQHPIVNSVEDCCIIISQGKILALSCRYRPCQSLRCSLLRCGL